MLLYKKADAQAKKTLKETKRENWRTFCMSLNKNTPSKTVWQKVNSFKNRKQKIFIQTSVEEPWIEEFQRKLTPPYPLPQIFPPGETYNRDSQPEYLTKPFEFNELLKALKTNNSAPGKDHIQYSIIWNLPDSIKKVLLYIFNKIYCENQAIPNDWLEYIIVPVLKPEKPPGFADSYRPIALALRFLKTYERIIKNRLEFWMVKNGKFPKTQFGFRKQTSTQEVLANLVTDIQLGFTENKTTSAIFLDIQGAYDSIIYTVLVNKMRRLYLPEQFICNIYKPVSQPPVICQSH